MPVNRNALIRYTTIDKCLRNRFRKWTLDDLTDACSDALYEYEGIRKGVSKRTTQLDIQTMRSEKLGYNAPIIVEDKKFYTYEDKDYSITQLPLSEQDLEKLNDAVEILKQFQNFNHFKEMSSLIQKLENKIYTEETGSRPIIHIDKNENLKGLEYLNELYNAILKKLVVQIEYKSFRAKNSQRIYFHAYLLKEYNNRWFVVGKKNKTNELLTLALDRILYINPAEEVQYKDDSDFHPDVYYQHVIGATVNEGMYPRKIKLKVDPKHAPYVITKPFHSSQEIISNDENGLIFTINVVPNFEMERIILGYGDAIEVIHPIAIRRRIKNILKKAYDNYKAENEEEENFEV